MRFEARVNSASLTRVRKAIETAPARVFPVMKREFERIGYQWENAVGKRFTGQTGETSLHTRTGALARSLSHSVSGSSLGNLQLRCVSQGPNYARAQNDGAVITPKSKRALTIPLDANKTPAGVPRFATVALLEAAYPGRVFLLKRSGKKPLIALKGVTQTGGNKPRATKGSGLSITPMFVLVPKVTLPGPKSTGGPSRLGFFDEFKKLAAGRTIVDRVAREFRRVS